MVLTYADANDRSMHGITLFWGLLAADYLSIMATSVSSEHAFSAAGITISKCRNHLKSDIVEALQCLKCFYHNDLLFREPETATLAEEEEEEPV